MKKKSWTDPDTIPWMQRPDRGRTDPRVARAYARRGWGRFHCRDEWEDSLRFKGIFTLSTKAVDSNKVE